MQTFAADITGKSLNLYLPQAKLGHGNYFYVYEGTYYDGSGWVDLATNYFGLSAVASIAASNCAIISTPNIPVAEAYGIDKKMDDGMPQSGKVMAWYMPDIYVQQTWTDGTRAGFIPNEPQPYSGALPGSATSCYDNSSASTGSPGISGATTHYSLEMNSGAGTNCALSFKFQ